MCISQSLYCPHPPTKVCIGMDTRAHSPKLAALAMKGATLAGAEVRRMESALYFFDGIAYRRRLS